MEITIDEVERATLTDAKAGTEEQIEYAIVEIFGHRKHAGRILEVERFGSKMLRIDVPLDGDFAKGFTSHFYGGASIFGITPCDLATMIKANKPYEPARLYHHAGDDEQDDDRLGEE